MASSKDYILQSWPQNDKVYNTKKFKIIRKSPVPVHIKFLTIILLVIFFAYLTIIQAYLHQIPIVAILQLYCHPIQRLLLTVSTFVVVNHILCIVFQGDFEESMLILKNIGIELSSTVPSRICFLPDTTKEVFIPIKDVLDIVIHEAFLGFEVIFYMIVLTRSAKKLTIAFENLLPRRHQLEAVLCGSRKVLFYGRDDNKLTIPGRNDKKTN